MAEKEDRIIAGLWNEYINPENYGSREQYYEHLFKQYTILVDMADGVSFRRTQANTFFLTLNTLLMGTAGFLFEKGPNIPNSWLNIFPLIAVLALCYFWWRLIRSYRQLNKVKYMIIGEYERNLPSSPLWSAEWQALGKGKDKSRYQQLTDIETYIPIIFAFMYVIGAVAIIFWG